eukprot:6213365-Pleurochrysis_carterae.AAC.4
MPWQRVALLHGSPESAPLEARHCCADRQVHTALRLHHSSMYGRRINVERTVGGGSATPRRQEKLKDLRERQGAQMMRATREMVTRILPADAAAAAAAAAAKAKEGDGEEGGEPPIGGATQVNVRVGAARQTFALSDSFSEQPVSPRCTGGFAACLSQFPDIPSNAASFRPSGTYRVSLSTHTLACALVFSHADVCIEFSGGCRRSRAHLPHHDRAGSRRSCAARVRSNRAHTHHALVHRAVYGLSTEMRRRITGCALRL